MVVVVATLTLAGICVAEEDSVLMLVMVEATVDVAVVLVGVKATSVASEGVAVVKKDETAGVVLNVEEAVEERRLDVVGWVGGIAGTAGVVVETSSSSHFSSSSDFSTGSSSLVTTGSTPRNSSSFSVPVRLSRSSSICCPSPVVVVVVVVVAAGFGVVVAAASVVGRSSAAFVATMVVVVVVVVVVAVVVVVVVVVAAGCDPGVVAKKANKMSISSSINNIAKLNHRE